MTLLTVITGTVLAATVDVIPGQVQITNSAGTGSVTDGVYTTTVTGGSFLAKSSNITILNNSDKKAVISFTYKAEGYSTFSIDGSSVASGTYSVTLDGLSSVKLITIKADKKETATLTLTDISYTPVASEIDVNIKYDSAFGIVTANGASVEANSNVVIGTAGVELTATPIDGAEFIGWVDENGFIRSQSATYTQVPDMFTTLEALFYKDSKPFFMVDDKYIFSDLNTAASSGTKIVLMRNAILPAGDYTIPSGRTLLIPFDAENTMYTDEPIGVNKNAGDGITGIGQSNRKADYQSPVAYRTLIMQEGANIIVNGTINLSAKHYAGDTQPNSRGGAPTGNVSFIEMSKNSSITVNNGGKLYAWGYITGEGNVTAESGAEVYEYFQFADFRGGSQTSLMVEGQESYRVFPLSQYYVQNIEVPLTIRSGAAENTYTSLIAGGRVSGSGVKFFGDGVNNKGMFNLESGHVIKRYDGAHDRLVVDLYGKMSVDPLNIKIATYDINSSAYELPINNNITINVREGSEVVINQNISLLPGAEIRIDEGAVGRLKSGVKAFVYDVDEWGTYCSSRNVRFCPVVYAPGRTYTRTEADMVDGEVILNGTFDASTGYVYTTESGANIYSEGTGIIKMQSGADTITHQVIQANPPEDSNYVPISVTNAKLKNNDGTYLEYDGKHSEFYYSNNMWNPTHTEVIVEAVAPTCTEEGKTEGTKCSICDAWINEQTTIPVTGHTFENFICECGEEKRVTSTEYNIGEEDITVTTNLTMEIPSTSVILIGIYDSTGRLLDSKSFLKSELDSVTFLNENVYKIRVFSWDGTNMIEPIALVEEILVK